MFSLIKLLAQFLHLVALNHQHNTLVRNLYRHATHGLESRLCPPVTLKTQASTARVSGREFGFTIGARNTDIADFKIALCFGKVTYGELCSAMINYNVEHCLSKVCIKQLIYSKRYGYI